MISILKKIMIMLILVVLCQIPLSFTYSKTDKSGIRIQLTSEHVILPRGTVYTPPEEITAYSGAFGTLIRPYSAGDSGAIRHPL